MRLWRQALNFAFFQECKPCFRSGGEANSLVALGELNVEVGDQRLHVVVAFDLQVEGGGEGYVLLRAGLDINLLDQAGVGDHLGGHRVNSDQKKNQG